jgi:predicted nucleic acid-binding protein
LRVVIDTNVIVSAIYRPVSPPGRVLDAGIVGTVQLCAPEAVREELRRVLGTVLSFRREDVEDTIGFLPIEWIEEGLFADHLDSARRLLRDPTDAPVLACALALDCDIISGDRDLQVVRAKGVRAWSPSEFGGTESRPSGKRPPARRRPQR